MRLAMILGKKQGEAIKPRLQGIKDNLDIDVFEDVPEFVVVVSKRNTIYDRILVLSTKINSRSLADLNKIWGAYSKETRVVMLSRKGQDEQKAREFLEVFRTPVACAMLVSSTTVQVIAESVLRPTAELTADYGVSDFLKVEVMEDSFVEPEPPKPVQPTPPPVQQAPPQQPAKPGKQDRKKKPKRGGGFLGGIFGSRGVEEPQEEPEQPVAQNQQEYPQQEAQYPEQPQPYQDQQTQGYPQQGQYGEVPQQSDAQEWESDTDFGSQTEADEDPYAGMQSQQPVQQYVPQDRDYREVMQSQPSPVQMPNALRPNAPSSGQNFNATQRPASSEVDVSFEGGFEDVPQQEDDFAPEPSGATADVNFGDEGLAFEPSRQPQGQTPGRGVEQADESFEDLSILSEEEQYRRQKETPKVITRTVVQNVPTSGNGSALKGVYAGRLKKVIVVTGDRGTGITSTAFNMATYLSKKVPVLYFDCDTDNHGLLNYIDYSQFKNYENTHMAGVKMAKSSQAFDRCLISWDDNLFLLSSDYSCECTNEELQVTAQVVAERSLDFGVVVVDCPVDKLPYITDLVLTGQTVICVEGSKRGFMNMLCRLESSSLPVRYKRSIISRGTLFVTKCSPKLDLKKLLGYIKAIYEPSEVDWLSIRPFQFNGKMNDGLLNMVMEG